MTVMIRNNGSLTQNCRKSLYATEYALINIHKTGDEKRKINAEKS
jgi:hypothetical protein